MTLQEKINFTKKINITIYNNLSYDTQAEIFQRIQKEKIHYDYYYLFNKNQYVKFLKKLR